MEEIKTCNIGAPHLFAPLKSVVNHPD